MSDITGTCICILLVAIVAALWTMAGSLSRIFNEVKEYAQKADKVSMADPLPAVPDKQDPVWPILNRARGLLIDKQIAGTLTEDERMLLEALQAYADHHINSTEVARSRRNALDKLESRVAEIKKASAMGTGAQ